MTEAEWNRLMRQARAHAFLHQHRVRIRSMQLTPLVATYFGGKWAYAIDCQALARDFMRSH